MSTHTIKSNSNSYCKPYYDLVIIGGGIQGAGVALLAKAVGYSVLLVEKNRWGSGTSSKSSKLIHGGLRYLQTGQFKLVYECLAERQWMLKKMPDLVKPNWFYIPVYKGSHYSALKIRAGLFLYRLLSGNTPYSQYKKVPRSEWDTLSGIEKKGLIAIFAYQDAQTDDLALTQTVIQRAQALGADCFEFNECLHATLSLTPESPIKEHQVRADSADESRNKARRREAQVKQYQLQLRTPDSKDVNVNCHTIINATGPWVNETLSRLTNKKEPLSIDLVQGSHLIVSPQLSSQCFYMEAPQDQRAVFCLPWKGKSMIGTTELPYQGKPEEAAVSEAEIVYLTQVIKHYFPNYHFSVDDQFCGLRVLPVSNKKAFFRSRDTVIHSHENIISLYGGKLTSWRATAKKVLHSIDEGFNKTSSIDLDALF